MCVLISNSSHNAEKEGDDTALLKLAFHLEELNCRYAGLFMFLSTLVISALAELA